MEQNTVKYMVCIEGYYSTELPMDVFIPYFDEPKAFEDLDLDFALDKKKC